MKWLTLSTNKGNDNAVAHLGLINLNRLEGKLNLRENTYYLFKRGAEQGFGQARASLGIKYESGFIVEANIIEAIKWYQRASNAVRSKAKKAAGLAENKLNRRAIIFVSRIKCIIIM